LSGPVAQVVPETTREAVFQLFCDIRANVPKDKRFLQRHANAFRPQSSIGWLALSGVMGYAVSAALLVTTLTLGISVAGLSMGLMAVLATGAFLASALGFMAFVLFTSAFVVGAIAFTALSGYVVGTSSLAVMHHITQLVFGGGGGNSGVKRSSVSPSLSPSAEETTATTTFAAVDAGEEEKPTNPSRPSTYAAARTVLPPIKTTSPTKKRSSPAVAATAAATSSSSSPDASGVSRKIEVTPSSAPLSPPVSSTSTSTAAKEIPETEKESSPPALMTPTVEKVVEDDVIDSSLEKLNENPKGETPTLKNTSTTSYIAIKTDQPSPNGTRTVTLIKPSNNENKKTSSPSPLPGPPPCVDGLLKPVVLSPPTTTAASSAAQDVSFSSTPSPNVTAVSNIVDSNESPGAFTSVMQGWKEIEKKAALESPSGDGVAKVPLPRTHSKKKGKSNKKVHVAPVEVAGIVEVSSLDPKTPET
jgi:hypothetical protein